MMNHESTAEIRTLRHDEIEAVSGSAVTSEYSLGFGIHMTVYVPGDGTQTVCIEYDNHISCGSGPAPK